MKNVEIYTIPTCPHCAATRELLDKKGVEYKDTDVSGGREEMIERTGGPDTVPQIFIDGKLVPDGNAGLQKLEAEGELDQLLGIE